VPATALVTVTLLPVPITGPALTDQVYEFAPLAVIIAFACGQTVWVKGATVMVNTGLTVTIVTAVAVAGPPGKVLPKQIKV
jgi:hypothetical protein